MVKLQVQIKKKLGNFCLDVAFEVEEGTFAILGASGCGKSMTLKCIAGIETPDEGKIILNNRVLFDSEKKINLPPQKRKVGYLFQDYALFPNMTTEKNIMAGMGRKPDMQKVKAYIRQFHLEGLENHYPAQLSGGQKQRVALARMIASEPEILLLDEPFSALDSHLKWKLEQQMSEILKKVGKPALFVSHNRDEVYRLCNMVGCIHKGKMEVVEPVKEFFHNPKTKTAAILSGCKNIAAVEIIDEHHLLAADWNVILTLPEIPENTKAVGIRAHSFTAFIAGKEQVNMFPLTEYQIIEDMFEWNVSFKTEKNTSWIQWKIAKKDWQERPEHIPEMLSVAAENILLLFDEN